MTTDPTIRAQGYQYFLQEAPELLQVLEQGLLTLQEDSSINKVNTLMRATHTLKGAAASLDLETIAKVAHSLEDVFRALCRPEISINSQVDALLFEGFECLRSSVRAELTETTVNEDEILNQTATIFAQLQDHLGDCFDQDTPLPTSAELGFDVTQSIFEVGVTQRLEQLAEALATEQPVIILETLQTQVEVFLGLGESLNLAGFGAIAQTTMAALTHQPDQVIEIAQLALQDFQAGQAAILNGDRTAGGQPSAKLQALAQNQPNHPVPPIAFEELTAFVEEGAFLEIDESQIPDHFDESLAATGEAIDLLPEQFDESLAVTGAAIDLLPEQFDESLAATGAAIDLPAQAIETIAVPEQAQTPLAIPSTDSDYLEQHLTIDNASAIAEEELPIAQTSDSGADFLVDNPGDVIEEMAAIEAATAAAVEMATVETGEAAEATPKAAATASITTENTNLPGIHKFFQWIRRSVQSSPEQTNTVSKITPSSQAAEPEQDINGGTDLNPSHQIDASPEEVLPEVSDRPDLLPPKPATDTDKMADFAWDQMGNGEDTNALLENIWGATVTQTDPEIDSETDSATDSDANPAALSLSANAIAPNLESESESESESEPEVLKLTDLPHLPRSQSSPKQSNPLPKKELTSPSPTVRIQIEHLDQLNYAIGELLTNHNQQSLQAEQIQTAMRQLYARLRQHHQLLSQLQDWLDYPTMPQAQSANGNGGTTFSTLTAPFHAESLGSDKFSSSSYPLPMGFDALELEQYSKPQLVIQSLLDDTVQLTEAVDAVELYTRQSRQTQEKQGRLLLKTRGALIEGRMFPMGQLFERFPRVLQQLETLHHKPIELTLQGNEVLVDKAIGERLYDPILHLVRNAFDHGIEPVEVRQQRAKPEAGQLEIVAHHQGKHLIIEVRDDGEGLNFERIRQRAVERQLVSPEQANRLSPAQLTDLLFEPGFSTASQISSLSGRGVGLDVVRNQLQSLRGEIAVNSVAHQGTTFTLRIPLSLTIAKLLLCQANDRAYALLPDAVEQILIPQADQIRQREHCKSLYWGEGDEVCLVPIYALSELLNYPEQAQQLPSQTTVSSMTMTPLPYVLLIRHQEVLIGLEVDQMLGEQELVIRPLDPLLKTHDYIYGASILADGQLTLVLDGETLARKATALQADQNAVSEVDSFATETSVVPNHRPQLTGAPPLETPTKQGQKLLVVDDSITTRQTLKLTLQKAGYQVIQAQDGQEAVEQLLQHPNVQLVICDIEMPRMNGFEFLQHCQHDPALAEFRVMMLSSRSSDKHRLLAEQLGAIAYISKPYLEHKLLAMITELLQVNVLSSVSE